MISNRPLKNAASIVLAASIPWALGGCAYIAGINEPARAGYAHVSIPRLDSGRPAVTVFHVRSNTGLFVELDIRPDVHEIASFALKPGDHTLEVSCTRPNAVDVVDGWWFFKVAVEANQSYLLDCAPMKAGKDDYDNHFSLTPFESRSTKEPPLELEPWLGCYSRYRGQSGLFGPTDRGIERPPACARTAIRKRDS